MANSKDADQWRKDLITAKDLHTMKFAPLRYAVPKIIPEGLTILAGRPKIGKSWLLLQTNVCLSNGVAALGIDYGMQAPSKGSVLYLALEDGKRRLQRRMTKLLGPLQAYWPSNLHLKTEWRRFDQGGLDDIRAWHADEKANFREPLLVSVDTLAKIRAPNNPKASPYQNDHDALSGLQKLAEELSIAVIVSHHDRKMDADDVFDTVSGTLGLTGAVDTILVLTKKASGTTLHIRGRDIEDETDLAMQFDKASCRWSVLGAASEVQRSDERKRIIDALTSAPDGMTVSEVAVAAAMRSRNSADQLLYKLATAGDIERVKRGLYGMPGTKNRLETKARADAAAKAAAKSAAHPPKGAVRLVRTVRKRDNRLKKQEKKEDSNLTGNLTGDKADKIGSNGGVPNLIGQKADKKPDKISTALISLDKTPNLTNLTNLITPSRETPPENKS